MPGLHRDSGRACLTYTNGLSVRRPGSSHRCCTRRSKMAPTPWTPETDSMLQLALKYSFRPRGEARPCLTSRCGSFSSCATLRRLLTISFPFTGSIRLATLARLRALSRSPSPAKAKPNGTPKREWKQKQEKEETQTDVDTKYRHMNSVS